MRDSDSDQKNKLTYTLQLTGSSQTIKVVVDNQNKVSALVRRRVSWGEKGEVLRVKSDKSGKYYRVRLDLATWPMDGKNQVQEERCVLKHYRHGDMRPRSRSQSIPELNGVGGDHDQYQHLGPQDGQDVGSDTCSVQLCSHPTGCPLRVASGNITEFSPTSEFQFKYTCVGGPGSSGGGIWLNMNQNSNNLQLSPQPQVSSQYPTMVGVHCSQTHDRFGAVVESEGTDIQTIVRTILDDAGKLEKFQQKWETIDWKSEEEVGRAERPVGEQSDLILGSGQGKGKHTSKSANREKISWVDHLDSDSDNWDWELPPSDPFLDRLCGEKIEEKGEININGQGDQISPPSSRSVSPTHSPELKPLVNVAWAICQQGKQTTKSASSENIGWEDLVLDSNWELPPSDPFLDRLCGEEIEEKGEININGQGDQISPPTSRSVSPSHSPEPKPMVNVSQERQPASESTGWANLEWDSCLEEGRKPESDYLDLHLQLGSNQQVPIPRAVSPLRSPEPKPMVNVSWNGECASEPISLGRYNLQAQRQTYEGQHLFQHHHHHRPQTIQNAHPEKYVLHTLRPQKIYNAHPERYAGYEYDYELE